MAGMVRCSRPSGISRCSLSFFTFWLFLEQSNRLRGPSLCTSEEWNSSSKCDSSVLPFCVSLSTAFHTHCMKSWTFPMTSSLILPLAAIVSPVSHARTHRHTPYSLATLQSWTSTPVCETWGCAASLLPPFCWEQSDFQLPGSDR